MAKTMMKAPANVTSSNIMGQSYDVPKNGIIEVKNPDHVEVLKRHGYVETDEQGEPDFDSMEKPELIAFIEERGGDDDYEDMKPKKLRRLAREAYEEQQNEDA